MSKILQYNIEGYLINTFNTKQEIYELGYQKDGLNRCLAEKKMTYKNYIWIWENDDKTYVKERIENIRKKLDPRYCSYCDDYFELPIVKEGNTHWRLNLNDHASLKIKDKITGEIQHFSLTCRLKARDRERRNRRIKGLKKWPKIHQIDKKGKIVRTLNRAKEFEQFGFNLGRVSNVCDGYFKTHNGYYFKYENDPDLAKLFEEIKKSQSNYCSYCNKEVTNPTPGIGDEHWRWVPNSSYKEYTTESGEKVRGYHRCKISERAYINRLREVERENLSKNQKELLLVLNKYIYKGRSIYSSILEISNKFESFEKIYEISEDLSILHIGDWYISQNKLKQVNHVFYVYCSSLKTKEEKWIKLNNFLLNRVDKYKIEYKELKKVKRKIFRGEYAWYFLNENKDRIKCDSSYEAIYASYLRYKKITFKYHPIQFKVSKNTTYTPDFYIVKDDIYIETKGLPNETKISNKQDKNIEKFKQKYNLRILKEQDIIEECGLTVKNIQSIKYKAERQGWSWEDFIVEMFERGLQ
jgi:hypothetical protein